MYKYSEWNTQEDIMGGGGGGGTWDLYEGDMEIYAERNIYRAISIYSKEDMKIRRNREM